jgi:hypothetical protein
MTALSRLDSERAAAGDFSSSSDIRIGLERPIRQ